jgi:hypothetical protein
MKLVPPDQRRAIAAVRLSLALAAMVTVPLLLYAAPGWWSQHNVLTQNAASDDYAPANHGQLKNIAKAAVAEMDAKLPGGAGTELRSLIAGWSSPTAQTNDFAAVNLGQLKTVAKPFYDRLIAAGLTAQYPWTNGPNQPDDFAIANVGQVKNVFSFDLPAVDPLYDGDHNGLPDLWEQQYFGHTGIDPNADFDGDGISNLQEYRNHSDPTDFFNGNLSKLGVRGGGDQRGNPGTLLPVPISVAVSATYSGVVWNAPVTVTIEQGAARLVPDGSGTSAPSTQLILRTNSYDNEGYAVAQFYVLLPPNPDLTIIRASAQGGTRSISVFTTAVAIDTSLAAPSNLSVTATSPSTAKLTWTAAMDSLPTTIQASIDDGKTWITLGAVGPGLSQATVTGLTPNQTTKFRIFSGGTPPDTNTNSFAMPDPSIGRPPPPILPGPNGGGAGDPAEVVPLPLPVVEVDQAEYDYGIGGGYLGMKPGTPGSARLYKNKEIVVMTYIPKTDDEEAYVGSTTNRFAWIPGNESYGRGDREVTTTSVTGEYGGVFYVPYQTVISTDSVLRLESTDLRPQGSTASKTVTLSNPFTDADAEAAGAAAHPQFYGEFYELRGNDLPAYFSHGHGHYYITVAKYRFKVNADPNLVVLWDVQFTPDDGGPVQHDIHSWHGDGSTYSPVFLLDPRLLNGGQNGSYRIVPLSAELLVDANRDGEMSFDDPAVHDADRTSEEKSYRFWVNDDDDGAAGDPGEHIPPTAPDYADGIIGSKRDLEDFTRLHVNLAGLEEAIESGSIKAAFEWKQTSGDPRIKLYRASKPGLDHLTNESAASALTLTPFRETLGEVTSGAPLFLSEGFWSRTSSFSNVPKTLPLAWFLFEASSEGKGELVVSFWKDGRKVGETPGVWLDLKNVKKLYQHQTLGGADPWGSIEFEPPDQEQKDVIVFVHGWRLSPGDTASFAETMFKRIWWRGFKGRFAAIRWDTYYNSRDHGWIPLAGQAIDAYLAQYNDSEHNAWLAGLALKTFVDDLPRDYTKNIVAHSMGNVVTGSALKYGMTPSNYALLNAALPASCYDENELIKQSPGTVTVAGVPVHLWNELTPDDDPDPATRALAYRGRLKSVAANLISFYLSSDYATSFAWELNNALTKPPGAALAGPFLYKRDFPPGQKLIKGIDDPSTNDVVVNYYIADANEAESYACRTWGKAVGAESRTAGPIASKVDLGSDRFSPNDTGGFGDEHSAEFNYEIQKLKTFYVELLSRFNISQNP